MIFCHPYQSRGCSSNPQIVLLILDDLIHASAKRGMVDGFQSNLVVCQPKHAMRRSHPDSTPMVLRKRQQLFTCMQLDYRPEVSVLIGIQIVHACDPDRVLFVLQKSADPRGVWLQEMDPIAPLCVKEIVRANEHLVSSTLKGSHYTLPISSTFPRELQLSALGIRLKVNLSTFFGRHTERADWRSEERRVG